jgi:hypothetical protein
MFAYLAGDAGARDTLASLQGQTLEQHRRRAAAGCP